MLIIYSLLVGPVNPIEEFTISMTQSEVDPLMRREKKVLCVKPSQSAKVATKPYPVEYIERLGVIRKIGSNI